MKTYIAHSQRIQSEWVLPEGVLPHQAGPFDLCFRRGKIELPSFLREDQGYCDFFPEFHDFYWPELGYFRTHQSGEVLVDEKPDAAAGLVQHVLLGPIMADWLMWKGLLPLHANCLSYSGGAFAIVGDSGAGKSTLGAAMSRADAVPHADDLIGVNIDTTLVPFGTSRTKLNPDVLAALRVDHENLPLVYATVEKKSVVLGNVSADQIPEDQPLRAIYCLVDSEDDTPRIDQVNALLAPLRIMQDVFRLEVQHRATSLQTVFDQCGKLSKRVPVFQLRRKKDLRHLEQLAHTLRDHFQHLTQTTPDPR